MRNLKRVLSLVMMIALLAGLMIVGASAGYKDFTDQDKIENKIAVETLVELGVISGKEDGSYYDPQGLLTRAEATKLVCFVLNGGKEPVLSDPSFVSFNDTKGHWAAKYIEYVASLDIVAGDGSGNFKPEENLTATQLAKMLLVALDYDADFEGLVGNNWDTKTDALANQKGLYAGLDNLITSQNLNRDNAAQIIYNALTAYIVRYTSEGSGNVGVKAEDTGATILGRYFQTSEVVGVVTANDIFAVAGAKAPKGKINIEIRNVDGVAVPGNDTLPIAVDNDMVGLEVTVFVKDMGKTSESVLGAVVATDNNTVATTLAAMKAGKDKGKTFLKDNGLEVAATPGPVLVEDGVINPAPGAVTDMEAGAPNGGIYRTAIDNNGDGAVDYILTNEKILAKVSKYEASKEEITLSGVGTPVAFKDMVAYEGIAKGDIVLYIDFNDTYYVEEAIVETATVEKYNATDNYIVADGVTYNVSALTNATNSSNLITANGNLNANMIGNEYDLYLDNGGNVIAYEKVSGLNNYALVTAANYTTNMVGAYAGGVKLLTADGEEVTYEVDLLASWKKFETAGSFVGTTDSAKQTEMANYLNSDLDPADPTDATDYTIVTYVVDDETGLVTIAPADVEAPTDPAEAPIKTNGSYECTTNTYMANAETIYFYVNADETYGVVTGLANLPAKVDTGVKIVNVAWSGNEAPYAADAAVIQGAVSSEANYVYVLGGATALGNDKYSYDYATVNGSTDTATVKSYGALTAGIFKLGTSGANDTLKNGGERVKEKLVLAKSTTVNTLVATDGTTYVYASNAQVLNVSDTQNVVESDVASLEAGMLVSIVLNSDKDAIEQVFIVDDKTDATVKLVIPSTAPISGGTAPTWTITKAGGADLVAGGTNENNVDRGTVLTITVTDTGAFVADALETLKLMNEDGALIATLKAPAVDTDKVVFTYVLLDDTNIASGNLA